MVTFQKQFNVKIPTFKAGWPVFPVIDKVILAIRPAQHLEGRPAAIVLKEPGMIPDRIHPTASVFLVFIDRCPKVIHLFQGCVTRDSKKNYLPNTL